VKVKLLNQRRPGHDIERLERLDALCEGGPDWHEKQAEWFPQRAVEPDDVYIERLALLTYQPHAGSVVSLLSALLFSEAPQVEGLDGDYYAALLNDCDGAGTPWRRWWRDALTDAQVGRVAYAWVNLPARSPDLAIASRGEEERAGLLDAYLVPIEACHVLDWEEDSRGNLRWMLWRDTVSERPSPDSPRQVTWRWTAVDATSIRRWTWTATEQKIVPVDEDEATEQPAIAHGIGRIPVVRLQLPEDLWTMSFLEDAAIAATRARNEHSWALHQSASELLVLKSKWEDTKPVLGHAHYLQIGRDKDGEDSAQYIGPSGVALQFLENDVKATREELFRLVRQMALAADSDATASRLSGASKSKDWMALEIILSSYQDLALQAMTETLRLIASIRNDDPADVHVAGLDAWQTEDLDVALNNATLAQGLGIQSPTLQRSLHKRLALRLVPDATEDEKAAIAGELDDADYDAPVYQPPPPPFTGDKPPAA